MSQIDKGYFGGKYCFFKWFSNMGKMNKLNRSQRKYLNLN